MGAEAVVVKVQVLQRHVGGEESDEGGLCVEAKCVIVQIDGVEVWVVEDGS